MRHRQPEHQRAQELRLARAGRADHEAVRAHALLGGLLEVQVGRQAALADADRNPQPVACRPRAPRGVGVEGVHVTEAEQVHEVGAAGELQRRRLVGYAGAGRHGVQRRQPPGEGLRGRQVALVAAGAHRLLTDPDRLEGDRAAGSGVPGRDRGRGARDGGGVVEDRQPQPGGVLELVPAGRQVHDGDAVQPVGRDDVVARGEVGAVEQQQDVRHRGTLVGAEAGPVGQVGGQQVGELVEGGGHHPSGADGVGDPRGVGVRQPLHPVPVRQLALTGQHRHHELVGGVEGGGRAHQGPGEAAGGGLGAAHLDPVEGAQVERGRQVGLVAVHDQQPVQGRRGGRVDLVDGGALGRDEPQRELLAAHAVPDVEEGRVAGAALPHPAEPVTDCARCFRCRSICTTMKPSVAKRNMPAAM